MIIPSSISKAINDKASPMDNAYFEHAKKALDALNKVTEESYCYDYMSNIINVLERTYKGFLKAATKVCDWYRLPSENFLTNDHDILGMVLEIKDNFPDVFPRVEREVWRDTKNFLRDLRKEYTMSRYESYPDFTEFKAVREYTNNQYKLITEFILDKGLEKTNDKELELDY